RSPSPPSSPRRRSRPRTRSLPRTSPPRSRRPTRRAARRRPTRVSPRSRTCCPARARGSEATVRAVTAAEEGTDRGHPLRAVPQPDPRDRAPLDHGAPAVRELPHPPDGADRRLHGRRRRPERDLHRRLVRPRQARHAREPVDALIARSARQAPADLLGPISLAARTDRSAHCPARTLGRLSFRRVHAYRDVRQRRPARAPPRGDPPRPLRRRPPPPPPAGPPAAPPTSPRP